MKSVLDSKWFWFALLVVALAAVMVLLWAAGVFNGGVFDSA